MSSLIPSKCTTIQISMCLGLYTIVKHGTQSFSVEIVDDSEIEEEETFSLSLIEAYPSDAIQFDPTVLHVTVTDNESKIYNTFQEL